MTTIDPIPGWRGYRWTLALLVLGACSSAPIAPPVTEPVGSESAPQAPEVRVTDVTLGPGDEIEVSVWRNPDLGGKYSVDTTGRMFLPLIGSIEVEGVGVHELRERIVTSLQIYLRDPQVTITVIARSRKFYVLGEVQRPGIFYLGNETVPLVEALAQAGGFTKDAKEKSVFHIRGAAQGNEVRIVNIIDIMKRGDGAQNALLQRGDIIYVPRTGMANTARFFTHLQTILEPFLTAERAIVLYPLAKDALSGERGNRIVVVPP